MEFCRQFIWDGPWNQQKWVCKKQEHAEARMSQDLANTSVSREALELEGQLADSNTTNWGNECLSPAQGRLVATTIPVMGAYL